MIWHGNTTVDTYAQKIGPAAAFVWYLTWLVAPLYFLPARLKHNLVQFCITFTTGNGAACPISGRWGKIFGSSVATDYQPGQPARTCGCHTCHACCCLPGKRWPAIGRLLVLLNTTPFKSSSRCLCVLRDSKPACDVIPGPPRVPSNREHLGTRDKHCSRNVAGCN